jgi:hypothetical protein
VIKRIILAIVAGAAIVAFGASGVSAASVTPKEEFGPFHILTLTGDALCMYAKNGSETVGNQVIQSSGTCSNLYEDIIGSDSNGYELMYLRFLDGDFLASDDACNFATIKGNDTDNGVVWTLYHEPLGTGQRTFLTSRYCGASYSIAIGGTNVSGDQWEMGGIHQGGLYTAIVINGS